MYIVRRCEAMLDGLQTHASTQPQFHLHEDYGIRLHKTGIYHLRPAPPPNTNAHTHTFYDAFLILRLPSFSSRSFSLAVFFSHLLGAFGTEELHRLFLQGVPCRSHSGQLHSPHLLPHLLHLLQVCCQGKNLPNLLPPPPQQQFSSVSRMDDLKATAIRCWAG